MDLLMGIRVYSGPMEEVTPDHWRTVASKYMTGFVALIPAASSAWVMTIGRATNWAAADADPLITNMFGPELDGSENTKAQFVAALQAKTLASVGVARGNAMKARLDILGVPWADFNGSTTIWRVFQRMLFSLMERDPTERDPAWGAEWTF